MNKQKISYEIEQEIETIQKYLGEWNRFKAQCPKEYSILQELCEPMIAILSFELKKPVSIFLKEGWDIEKINYYKAELAGKLSVWEDLLYKFPALEKRLKELKETQVKFTEQEKNAVEKYKNA